MFILGKVILFAGVIWCLAIGILHVTPKWRDRWDKKIRNNGFMHISIGILAFFVAILNIFLFLFSK